MTNQAMLDFVAYKTYYAIASGAEPPKSKKSKMKDLAISSKETPSKKKPTKSKKDVPSMKKSASKPKPTKKKAPVEGDRGKGLNVLSKVALSEAAQLKEATKQSKKDFHISQVSGSGDGTDFESGVPDEQQHKTSGADEGTGTKPGVPDVPKYLSESENESFEFNDDNEEYDELYKDVNVRSKVAEHKEVGKEDAEMTDTTHEIIDKVSSMMNVKTSHEELSTQAPPKILVPVTAIPKTSTVHITTFTLIIQPFSSIPQMTTPTPVLITEPTTSSILDLSDFTKLEKSKSYRATEQHRDLYDALVKSYQLNKDLFDSYGKTFSLKRGREDKDKDEDPPARSDQGLKKKKTSKDAEPSRGLITLQIYIKYP
ncbi:hypothetical protein Tco_0797195 [Tanacetum coccineum]